MEYKIITVPFEEPIEASSPEEAISKFAASMNTDMNIYFQAIPIEQEEDNRVKYPCDYTDEDGLSVCPFEETYTGYEDEMCRCCCGLGVDE